MVFHGDPDWVYGLDPMTQGTVLGYLRARATETGTNWSAGALRATDVLHIVALLFGRKKEGVDPADMLSGLFMPQDGAE